MATETKYNFQNQVAFITGASTGIGRATALAFARSNARVALADSNTDEGLKTVELIRQAGGTAVFFRCDVSKSKDVNLAIEQTIQKFGQLDIAFNNAGIEGESAAFAEASEVNFDRVIGVDLKGVWLCMHAELPQMLKQKRGSIINCSSIAGVVGFSGIGAYVASKHGVIGLTKTAALEYAKNNIRVNAICPGVIKTPMIDRFTKGNSEATQALVTGEPLGRMGTPEEMAAVALWLASDESSFVTGHALVADGGWVAQ